eukprot:scaffold116512_cov87-Phaeocystis_antarctica.AAC.6
MRPPFFLLFFPPRLRVEELRRSSAEARSSSSPREGAGEGAGVGEGAATTGVPLPAKPSANTCDKLQQPRKGSWVVLVAVAHPVELGKVAAKGLSRTCVDLGGEFGQRHSVHAHLMQIIRRPLGHARTHAINLRKRHVSSSLGRSVGPLSMQSTHELVNDRNQCTVRALATLAQLVYK